MGQASEIEEVETGDEYVHVRFRNPDDFDTIRTPDWAQNAAESISSGSEVRTGKEHGSDEWEVQSVLIKKNVGEEKAREQAREILRKLQS